MESDSGDGCSNREHISEACDSCCKKPSFAACSIVGNVELECSSPALAIRIRRVEEEVSCIAPEGAIEVEERRYAMEDGKETTKEDTDDTSLARRRASEAEKLWRRMLTSCRSMQNELF
mmetsp:Transcript_22384/g.48657  ORF Transcript_22384/g.48657 Transcript_22384/m.48657 type:complete len:119 (+) Transcript_22384:217-573(+)